MLTKSELKQWTDALRSGEYIQGQSFLKKTSSKEDVPEYCCLGVLCEINKIPNNFRVNDFCYGFEDGQTTVLPDSLVNKLSMDKVGYFSALDIPWLNEEPSLASAKDSGVTFTEIADHLDKYYPTVED